MKKFISIATNDDLLFLRCQMGRPYYEAIKEAEVLSKALNKKIMLKFNQYYFFIYPDEPTTYFDEENVEKFEGTL